jgi:hypothetical protein
MDPTETESGPEPNDFVVDVFGLCTCCNCLRASWKELLEHFPEHLPRRGDAQALRVSFPAFGATTRTDRALLIGAVAHGVGRLCEGNVFMPGLIFHAAANGH